MSADALLTALLERQSGAQCRNDAAFRDVLRYGSGMVRQYPDGSVEHIPHGQWHKDEVPK